MSESPEDDGESLEESLQESVQFNTSISTDYKVLGRKNAPDGTGVLGHNTATSGRAFGIEGITESSHTDAAGIYGEATPRSGSTLGVHGVTQSPHNGASGVLGVADSGDADGVIGVARNGGIGVGALTDSPNQAGMLALNTATSGQAIGLKATTDSSSDGSTAVLGEATAGSGPTFGVRGETTSEHADAAGVVGIGTGNAAAIRAEGHIETTNVGLSVWLGSDQIIPSETEKTILFDQIRRDDFNGYDPSTGVYTVQERGDYHVDFTVRWRDFFGSDGTINQVRHRLYVNQSLDRGIQYLVHRDENRNYQNHSKTVFDLERGDTLKVTVKQSGDENAIRGDATRENEYLTIHKVG